MALRRDITARIIDLLRQNPQGLSITEIVENSDINRNTAGRYLDNLLISGQVEMRHFGMAKIYTLSQRLPVSSVLSLSSEFLMQIDNGLRVVFLNKPFASLLGADEKEITGKNIEFTKIPPFFDDSYPPLLTSIREGLAGKEFRGELTVPVCDRSFSYRVVPIVFTNGQKGVSVIFDDITERKRNETLLRESEERFRALVNNANDMITLHGFGADDLPGRYIEVNEEACRRLGYTRQELLALSPKDLIAPECAGNMIRNAKKLREHRHATFEMVHRTKDGRHIPVEINAHIFEFHGEPVVLALVRDITERKLAEKALQESEEKFRALFNNAEDMIMLHELRGDKLHSNYIEVNDMACRKLKYTRQELLTMAPRDLVAEDSLPLVSGSALRNLHEDGYATFESILLTKDRQRLPVEINVHLFNFKGKPVALAIIRDISRRKLAEDQLRLMKISIDNAYDEVFWMDMQANFLYVNDAACRVTGYSPEELYAMKVFTLDPDFTPARWEESIADLRKNKKQFFQTRHKRKDGIILDVEIGSVYVTRGEEEFAFCFVRDITGRTRTEAALRESEARYRSLAEASQDLIFVIDREDRVQYINQQAADFLEISPDSVTGKPRSELFSPEASAAQYKNLQYVFTTGLPMRNETPMVTHRGETRWFDHALMPILDTRGNVTSVLGVSRDVTKRIAAEREQRQNEESNRFIAEHSVDIIHRLSPECTLLYTSPSVTTLLGYSPEEVLGKPVLGMIHPEDLPGVMRDIQIISKSGQDTITSTFRFRHKDGHYILFESTTRIVRDASGKIKEFLNISRDITGRKEG